MSSKSPISRPKLCLLISLQVELKKRGLEIKGKKQDLVDRLKDAITNGVPVQAQAGDDADASNPNLQLRKTPGQSSSVKSVKSDEGGAGPVADPTLRTSMDYRIADLTEAVYLPSSPPPPEVYWKEQQDLRESLRRQALASQRPEFQPRGDQFLRFSDAAMLRQAADRPDGWVSVRDLETKRQEQEESGQPQTSDLSEGLRFGTQPYRGWRGQGDGGYKSAVRCSFCGKLGHTGAQCYFRRNSFSRDSSERSFQRNFDQNKEGEVCRPASSVSPSRSLVLQTPEAPAYEELSDESTPSAEGG
eukprot:763072-Hanusia_phi.AAC.5